MRSTRSLTARLTQAGVNLPTVSNPKPNAFAEEMRRWAASAKGRQRAPGRALRAGGRIRMEAGR
ncbi:protein of unknown function [Burkholderia multivorans]